MSHLRQVPLDENGFPPFAEMRRAFGFVPNFFQAQTLRSLGLGAEPDFRVPQGIPLPPVESGPPPAPGDQSRR
ncbi:MAG: hypothetical protein ACRD5D_08200 [Candidatus Polarisedimenticolia bacterium]